MNVVVLSLVRFMPDILVLSLGLFATYISGKYGLWPFVLIGCVLSAKLVGNVMREIQELRDCGFFDETGNEESENDCEDSEPESSVSKEWCDKQGFADMELSDENNDCEQSLDEKVVVTAVCIIWVWIAVAMSLGVLMQYGVTDVPTHYFVLAGILGTAIMVFSAFRQASEENSDVEETNQNTESENGTLQSVTNAVQPIVKAAAKAKVVAPYQNKMDRLTKQYKEYETELHNLGMETTSYKKCLDAIKSEFNRQCEYVARIAEIERKQSTPSDNEKTAEISKKIRSSYKAHKDEAVKSIESLIDSAEQVVVLMQQDLQNQIFDAHAQVETGKISDMLAKLKSSVQLDKEINGEAAKICLELKGIDKKAEN